MNSQAATGEPYLVWSYVSKYRGGLWRIKTNTDRGTLTQLMPDYETLPGSMFIAGIALLGDVSDGPAVLMVTAKNDPNHTLLRPINQFVSVCDDGSAMVMQPASVPPGFVAVGHFGDSWRDQNGNTTIPGSVRSGPNGGVSVVIGGPGDFPYVLVHQSQVVAAQINSPYLARVQGSGHDGYIYGTGAGSMYVASQSPAFTGPVFRPKDSHVVQAAPAAAVHRPDAPKVAWRMKATDKGVIQEMVTDAS